MHFYLTKYDLLGLALFIPQIWQASASQYTGSPNEPAFGIEITLNDLRVSVAVQDAQPIELTSTQGSEAYKSLMRSYLDLCERVRETQEPPWDFLEYRNNLSHSRTWREEILEPEKSWRDWFLVNILGRPEAPASILDRDDFLGDREVAVLAEAMGAAKASAIAAMRSKLSNTVHLPERPFLGIAAPSFLWTAIQPEPWEGDIPDWGQPDDASMWHYVLALKFAGAAHRAGFRRHESEEPRLIMDSHATLLEALISPAGNDALRLLEGVSDDKETVVVVDLNDAVLSFWVYGTRTKWTPWSTYRDIDGDLRARDVEQYWSRVMEAHRRLLEKLELVDEPLRYLLTGNAWDSIAVEAFKQALDETTNEITDVQLKGEFAASLGAASLAEYGLHLGETICMAGGEWFDGDPDALRTTADREL